MMYDLCIVGAGMIGSSAARYATLTSDNKVCLIGPSEPKKRCKGNNCDIYGAYYDEARITRSSSSDVVWAKLATASIQRYREIETLSGITFYHEVGNITAGCGEDSKFLTSVRTSARKGGVKTKPVNNQTFRKHFPYLKVRDDLLAELETHNAGYINPRNLVKAQMKIASKQGCTIYDDVVRKIERIVQSNGSYVMKVVSDKEMVIYAKKVLVATGAFTNFRQLVPSVQFDYSFIPRIVVLAEVDFGRPEMKQLRDMPCFIYEGPPHNDWILMEYSKGRQETSVYIMPPVKYPDGRYYIKAGVLDPFPIKIETKEEVKQWYDEGNEAMHKRLVEVVQSMFNGIEFNNWKTDTCGIMKTPTNHPYIDKVHDQLGVAIGGNGRAAKSCDEIGRIAVSMMLKGWDSDLPQHMFRVKVVDRSKL